VAFLNYINKYFMCQQVKKQEYSRKILLTNIYTQSIMELQKKKTQTNVISFFIEKDSLTKENHV